MIKRFNILFVILLIISITLYGCSISDFVKDNNKENNSINGEKIFEVEKVTDDTIAIIVNEYNDDILKTFDRLTTIRLDGTEEETQQRLLIIPMKDNIDIEIWSVDYIGNKFIEKNLEGEIKGANKNYGIEIYAIKEDSIPSYKIKIKSDIGESEYYINYKDAKDNKKVEYIIASLDNEESNEKLNEELSEEFNEESNRNNVVLDLRTFIPNEEIEIKYEGSDFVPQILYIRGNGTSYQTVGVNGKGAFVNVYRLINNELSLVCNYDLTEDEMKNVNQIDYLDKDKELDEIPLLTSPIKVGTKWDNKEIVEIGEDLKLDNLTLEGAYIKTWEKTKYEDTETVSVYYYVEGLGCVEHRVIVNGEIIEWSRAKEVIKK